MGAVFVRPVDEERLERRSHWMRRTRVRKTGTSGRTALVVALVMVMVTRGVVRSMGMSS
jgi:hypothetical protein